METPWRPGRPQASRAGCVCRRSLLLLIWMIVPLAMTLDSRFRYYNLLNPAASGWAGLRELPATFSTDPAFWQAIRNTLYIVLGRARDHPIRRHRRPAVIRPADLRPGNRPHPRDLAVLRDAAGCGAGLEEHDPAPGLRGRRGHSEVLRRPRPSTGSPAYPLFSIIVIVAWQWLPFATLILLTALQSLDSEQKEAAEMDGAGFISRFVAT